MNDALEDMDAIIAKLAELNGISLEAEMMPQIRAHLDIAARMAKGLIEFPLDDHEEPATVFTP